MSDRIDRKEYLREYYQENKERMNQNHADWYQRNRDKVQNQRIEYRSRGKQCPRCGEPISVWQSTCRQCRPVRPKNCRRCGQEFMPSSNYRQVCDDCLTHERYIERVRELSSIAEPCTMCHFLERCKLEIRKVDGWPLCWASSPARGEFINFYLGQKTMQGQLAKTLAEACEMEPR